MYNDAGAGVMFLGPLLPVSPRSATVVMGTPPYFFGSAASILGSSWYCGAWGSSR